MECPRDGSTYYDPMAPGTARTTTVHSDASASPGANVAGPVRRISWGAILAGVAVLLVVQLLLALLGLGVGLATVDPAAGGTPQASSLGLGAGIWGAISVAIATLVGAWVAGRLAGIPSRLDGMLHGIVTWAVATLLAVYLLSSAASGIVRTGFNTVGSTLSALGQGAGGLAGAAGQAAQQVLPPDLRAQAEGLFQRGQGEAQQTAQEAQAATGTTNTARRRPPRRGRRAGGCHPRGAAGRGQPDRAAGRIPPEEAQQRLDQFQTTYRETTARAAETARQTGQQAAEGASARRPLLPRSACWSA
jgi:hypothetical protein